MGRSQSQHQNNGHRTNPWGYALELGIFAGIIWGAIHWVFYSLHFTVIVPGFLGEPYFKHAFLKSGLGQFVGWLFFIVLSIIASYMYIFLFRKMKGPWPGIAYGIVWWILIFVAIGPYVHMVKPINKLTWDTLVSEFCIFLLWGLFIGYTIAVEYTDERKREPQHAGG
ncbi:YqhR family membrane protein [Paenibacillus pini]|uniref:Membrane protein YqhR n=1 Tax=Paenibacillus pini JCM 16418 TaxID=1236976 RepID=W7YW97_9BACL|nr:YqhR family membrane protein [Paenibacillus pini]GAF08921.1 hypothetical protein JCM16418_3032 [Paenibacillus pini JCM 16418]